jgi:signal transduction histidine kinase
MWRFRRLSIKHKLMAIMLVTSGIALLLMALGILLKEAVNERRSIQEQLATLAEVIASRSTAALTFNDKRTAEENLSALKVKLNIVYAVIEQENGDIFAEYGGQATRDVKFIAAPGSMDKALDLPSFYLIPDTIEVSKDILLEDERIGSIRIISNVEEFYNNLIDYLSFIFLIVLICFVVAFVMGSRLQRVISGPILNLREAMKTVSEQRDYSVRVEGSHDDELSALIEGFNHMLQQVQMRDEELARYSMDLEAEVAARTAELSEANKKRILWLENMASFLRHELKNTTIGVKTSLDLIDRRTQDRSIEIYLERARRSMSYMKTLLESVSNASGLEAAVYKEPLSPLNLSGLVETRLHEYRSMYSDHTFVDDCEEEIAILGNESRLIQMLDNLVSNAVEHCKMGTSIVVSLQKSDRQALLSIIDEGVKLPKDKNRIFELFFSMRDPERKKNDNLGLGLYIVKLVAESHRGHVQAKDLEEKEGAEFTVTLPLV